MSHDSFNEGRAELFEALGHPLRISILEALEARPMGFAEIKRSVGIDSSGHLQFHLRKLGSLVEGAENGSYALTDDGREALRVFRIPTTDIVPDHRSKLNWMKMSKRRAAIASLLVFLAVFGAFVFSGSKVYTFQRDLTTYASGPYVQGSWNTVQLNSTGEWARFNIGFGGSAAGNQTQQMDPVTVQLVHQQGLTLQSLSMEFIRNSPGCYWSFDSVNYNGVEGYPPPSAKLYTSTPGDTKIDLQDFGFIGTGSVNIFLNLVLDRVASQPTCQNANGLFVLVIIMQLRDSNQILVNNDYLGNAYVFITPQTTGLLTIDHVS